MSQAFVLFPFPWKHAGMDLVVSGGAARQDGVESLQEELLANSTQKRGDLVLENNRM